MIERQQFVHHIKGLYLFTRLGLTARLSGLSMDGWTESLISQSNICIGWFED